MAIPEKKWQMGQMGMKQRATVQTQQRSKQVLVEAHVGFVWKWDKPTKSI